MSEYKPNPEPTLVEAPWMEGQMDDPDLHFGRLMKMAFPPAAVRYEFKQQLIETSLSILYKDANDGDLEHPAPRSSVSVNFAPNERLQGEGKDFKRGEKAWRDRAVSEQE